MTQDLIERDAEVLNELRGCMDMGLPWARPMDCGGSNGSDHSYRLNKLAKMGLAETEQRSAWAVSRGSKKYRITDAGRAALRAHREGEGR